MIYIRTLRPDEIERAECIKANGTTESITSVHARTGADIIINAPIYEFKSGEIKSYFICNGVEYCPEAKQTFGIAFEPKPAWRHGNSKNAPNYVGAFTHSVLGGTVADGLRDEKRRGRTALGMKADGSLVIYVATDESAEACTTQAMCAQLIALGCVNAINLDGGGSSQFIAPDAQFVSTRSVVGYVAIWLKKEDNPIKVCIDAGHGVEVAGKRSPDGSYLEHEFNLDVAKHIKAHMERCGVQVVMTRTDEHDISLAERCKICNDAGCDYFVSIHTNAAGDGWSEAQGWSAHIIAKGGKAEQLANKIRLRAIVSLGCRDRGVNVNNYQVLRDTKCPAVLIEHGFHTSKVEVEKLKSAEYRAKCAESDARGLCDQMGIAWVDAPSTLTVRRRVIDGEVWIAAEDIK